METDEKVLIDRVVQGDQSAFGPLMALHSPRIRRMITVRIDSRLRGRVDESDVFQELQMDVLRRLPEYAEKNEMGFFEWVRFLGRQKLAEMSRRHIHAQARDVRREENPGHLPGHESSIALASFLVGEITSPSLQVSRARFAKNWRQRFPRWTRSTVRRFYCDMPNNCRRPKLRLRPVFLPTLFVNAICGHSND